MAIPDYKHHVAAAAARYPDAWRAAHTGGPDTERFIRLLAADLHAIDRRVGLCGKRGNPNDISDDALAIYTDDGSVHDRTGRRMEIIDVIVAAGGPNPQPGWAVVGGPSPGAWVQPERVSEPSPQPSPEPPAPVPVCTCGEQLNTLQSAFVAFVNQVGALRNDTLQIHHQLAVLNQRQDEIKAHVADVRECFREGLAVELEADLRGWGVSRGQIRGKASV